MESVDEIFDDANGDLAIGELESAVEKYRRCVELDPQFFDGWHALGMALMKLGRFPEAIEAGKKTVELRPNDQIGWTSLSLILQPQRRHQGSRSGRNESEDFLLGREDRQGVMAQACRRPRAGRSGVPGALSDCREVPLASRQDDSRFPPVTSRPSGRSSDNARCRCGN